MKPCSCSCIGCKAARAPGAVFREYFGSGERRTRGEKKGHCGRGFKGCQG